jgi:hypothetical protein
MALLWVSEHGVKRGSHSLWGVIVPSGSLEVWA